MSDGPVVAIVTFPGSNDDRDAALALGSVGAEPALVWHEETTLPAATGAVVLPGISIGRGAIIAAGAVVHRDVPEGVTVIGRPAT